MATVTREIVELRCDICGEFMDADTTPPLLSETAPRAVEGAFLVQLYVYRERCEQEPDACPNCALFVRVNLNEFTEKLAKFYANIRKT